MLLRASATGLAVNGSSDGSSSIHACVGAVTPSCSWALLRSSDVFSSRLASTPRNCHRSLTAMWGSLRMISKKSDRRMDTTSLVSIATTSAERGTFRMSAISPK